LRLSPTLFLVGLLLIGLAATMLAPLGVALFYADGSAGALVKSIIITVAGGAFLAFAFRPTERISLSHREGMGVVALAWMAAGLFGCLPFLLGGVTDGLTDSYFEAISGFTTTGASVLTQIESVPKGLLFWRSLTHWLGGMGIIVLGVAILPLVGVGGMQLYKAEVPSPVVDRLRPRITETARTMWKVYLLISAAEVGLLFLGGMNLFDSACHTFGTLATGGFSTRDGSIGVYGGYVQYVIIVFMFLAGVNFSLHYRALLGRPQSYLKDPELRVFVALIFFFSLLVVVNLYFSQTFHSLEESIRHGLFQVVAIISTTGYTTADFGQWPSLAKVILLFCMFLGASAGSTGGGIKIMRLMLLVKHAYRELMRLVHPRAVIAVKLGGSSVPDEVLNAVWGFLGLYLTLFVCGFLGLAALGLDLTTSFTAVAATIGNIGPGLGLVGPAENYAAIPTLGKWILVGCMLLGRLEIYTVIILMVPEFWRK